MSSLQVSAILVSSLDYVGQCYYVIGQTVGKVRMLQPQKDYFDHIIQSQITISDCKKGIQLWSYTPQKLIRKWRIIKNKWKLNGSSYSFQDQNFRIVLILNNRKDKINVNQKKQQKKRKQSKNKEKSYNKKIHQQNNTNSLRQIQKRLQQKLISLKRPKRFYSEQIQTCYSMSRLCYLNSKHSSKVNSTLSLSPNIQKITLKNSKETLNQSFNFEAHGLYGLNELVSHKQQIFKQISLRQKLYNRNSC